MNKDSFAYGDSCSSERNEYKRVLECYKRWLGDVTFFVECLLQYSLKQAREWLERAKINLEICLADSYQHLQMKTLALIAILLLSICYADNTKAASAY